MNILCKLLGHKYVSTIKTKLGTFGLYEKHYITELTIPRCKRYGIKMNKND